MNPPIGKLLVASVGERALHVGSIVLNRNFGINKDLLSSAQRGSRCLRYLLG
jgi:hypothetical protein